jgi:uncharacterized protein (DUF885 family)
MKAVLKFLGWALLALVLVGGYGVYRIGYGKPFSMNQLANRQALDFVLHNPELFSQIGLVDGTMFDTHSGKLAEVGVGKRDADYARAEKYLRELRQFDRAKLNAQDQITYDILEDQYTSALAFRQFGWISSEGLYPINPMWGTNVGLPTFMQTGHTIKNKKTAENYVLRLEAMGAKLDAVTAEMERQAAAGVVLPISLVERSIQISQDTIAGPPADNALMKTFSTGVEDVEGLDETLRQSLSDRALKAVETGVYPAYQRMIAALEKQKAAAATQAAGVGRLPDGAALYAVYLKQFTTTDYTAEQIHQLGLSEVTRITAEMDAILKAQGMTKGTVAERVQELNKRPDQLYPNTDEGREQIIARYNEIMREIEVLMPQYFNTIPPGQLSVQRVPPALEKGAAGGSYQTAAMDGSRPGTFYANLRDTAETPRYSMKSLAYHEGVPGHHFQIDTALHLKDMPIIRQQTLYTAYAEGWGLYAERLAAEIGMYKDDPLSDLGRLQAEIFRAVRLVVDSGMHAKGWTREQAITYMVANTGMAESDVTTEIERYMAMPGQACAYKVGQLKILELRERAKAELGAKFDLKDFHSVVLENGGVPLTTLDRLVTEWIAKVKAS